MFQNQNTKVLIETNHLESRRSALLYLCNPSCTPSIPCFEMSFVQASRIETNRVDLYAETTDAITSNNVMSIYLQLCKESLNSLKIPKGYPETVY